MHRNVKSVIHLTRQFIFKGFEQYKNQTHNNQAIMHLLDKFLGQKYIAVTVDISLQFV